MTKEQLEKGKELETRISRLEGVLNNFLDDKLGSKIKFYHEEDSQAISVVIKSQIEKCKIELEKL